MENTINEVIRDIVVAIEDQRETTSNLYDILRDVEKLLNSLENDQGAWLADGLFRPGNKERKSDAIDSLKTLKGIVLDAIKLSEKATNTNLPDLKEMATTVKTWPEYFDDIKSVDYTNDTIHQVDDNDAINNIFKGINIFAAGNWKVLGKITKRKTSFSASLLVLEGVRIFVGAIFSGEKRKATFEKIKNDADNNIELMNEIVEELNTLNKSIEQKFHETSIILVEAKFAIPGSVGTHGEILERLVQATLVIKDWAANYKVMRRELSEDIDDIDALTPRQQSKATAKRIIWKEEELLKIKYNDEKERIEWVQKVFYLTYLIDWEDGYEGPVYMKLKAEIEKEQDEEEKIAGVKLIINETGREVGISENQENFVLIRTFLILGLNPEEIINIVVGIGVLTKGEVEEKISFFTKSLES